MEFHISSKHQKKFIVHRSPPKVKDGYIPFIIANSVAASRILAHFLSAMNRSTKPIAQGASQPASPIKTTPAEGPVKQNSHPEPRHKVPGGPLPTPRELIRRKAHRRRINVPMQEKPQASSAEPVMFAVEVFPNDAVKSNA